MPNVPAPTLSDIPAKERRKLETLIHERDVLGYAFSYKKLFRLIEGLGSYSDDDIHAALQDCILAFDTPQEDDAKKDLNDRITAILAEHGLQSMRSPDPFGRLMDVLVYESRSGPKFNRDKAVEIAPTLGVSTTKIMEILERATSPGKPFVAVKVQAVKQKDGEGE